MDMRLPPIQASFAMAHITAGKIYVKETDGTAFFFPHRGACVANSALVFGEHDHCYPHTSNTQSRMCSCFLLHPTRQLPPPLLTESGRLELTQPGVTSRSQNHNLSQHPKIDGCRVIPTPSSPAPFLNAPKRYEELVPEARGDLHNCRPLVHAP